MTTALHHRMISQSGEQIQIRRYTGVVSATRVYSDWDAVGKLKMVGGDPLTGSSEQSEIRVIISHQSLLLSGFPLPIMMSDKVVIRGAEREIKTIDPFTKSTGGGIGAHAVMVRG